MAKDKKMSDEEQELWKKTDEILRNLMGYVEDENGERAGLTKDMVLRLRGLMHGRYKDNPNTYCYAKYSYRNLLDAFEYYEPLIQYAMRGKSFNDEMHKFNFITKIIERKLPEIRKMQERKKNAINKIQDSQICDTTYIDSKYKYIRQSKPTDDDCFSDKYDSLW